MADRVDDHGAAYAGSHEDANPVVESEGESVGEEPLLRPTCPRLACSRAIAPKPEGLVSYGSSELSDVELASAWCASVVFSRGGS